MRATTAPASQLCLALVMLLLPWLATSEDDEPKLPSYVDVCYRDDPKVAKCIKKNIEKLVPLFKSGSKDFNLQSLDPLHHSNLSLSFRSSILGGKLDLPFADLYGLSKLKVLSVRPKTNIPGKFDLGFDINFPLLNTKAAYELNGNVIRVPVNMKGLVNANFEDVNITYRIIGEVESINDYDYLVLRSFTWNLKGEGVRNAYLINDDVVIGRPALNTLTRNLVNSSWKQLKTHALPSILRATETEFKDIFFDFFKKYPYDVLFPKRTRTLNVKSN